MEGVPPEVQRFENFTPRGKEKIAEICRVAARVFSEKSYLSATLGDVAQAAGITKGGIFHYFSTKEELLFLILYRHMQFTLQALKGKLHNCDTPYEKIYVFIHHHLNNYRNKQAEARLTLQERVNLPAQFLDVVKDMEREYREIVRSIIEQLVTGQKKTARGVLLATYTLLGMVTFPYNWFDPEGKATPSQLGDLIYEIFLGGLVNQGPPPPIVRNR